MFKAEFLPHVVKKQFARPTTREEAENRDPRSMVDEKHSSDRDEDEDMQNDASDARSDRRTRTASSGSTLRQRGGDIFSYVNEDEMTDLVREMSAPWEFFGNSCRKMLDSRNKIRCYACVVDCGGGDDAKDSATCIRGNNLMTYMKANFEAANVLAKWNPGLERVHPSAQVTGRLRSQVRLNNTLIIP